MLANVSLKKTDICLKLYLKKKTSNYKKSFKLNIIDIYLKCEHKKDYNIVCFVRKYDLSEKITQKHALFLLIK
jgi:hypothetical protein